MLKDKKINYQSAQRLVRGCTPAKEAVHPVQGHPRGTGAQGEHSALTVGITRGFSLLLNRVGL